jgi:transposase
MACGMAEQVRWAVDISSRTSALLLALLAGCGQPVAYIPGRTVNRMSGAYSGEGKTDAKDAAIIADTLRMRRDFRPVAAAAERASELGLLTSYRRDLVADRVRMVNRLRELLAGICPALERQFHYRRRPGLVLLCGYQTPSSLRRIGVRRLTAWLARRGVRNPEAIAARAVQAAQAQRAVLPGERRAARIVADLARQILDLDARIKDVDSDITEVFRGDERAKVIESLPGMGPILGAEFLAVVTDLGAYKDAGHLAAHAGLAPVPRDSGRKTGSLRRPRHYDRRLRRLFYLAAQTAMSRPGSSRDYYRKKRSEGLIHTQAVLCLARRRVNVLWAMIRDRRPYATTPPLPGTA